jgi:Mor family transcriptional regulator
VQSFVLQRARAAEYPGVFQDFREVIGADKADVIVKYLGGTNLYIPNSLKHQQPLSNWLGVELAQQVCAEFGGLTIEIPRQAAAQRATRNALIIADRAAGLSVKSLALKYQMTMRNIRTISKHDKELLK